MVMGLVIYLFKIYLLFKERSNVSGKILVEYLEGLPSKSKLLLILN